MSAKLMVEFVEDENKVINVGMYLDNEGATEGELESIETLKIVLDQFFKYIAQGKEEQKQEAIITLEKEADNDSVSNT